MLVVRCTSALVCLEGVRYHSLIFVLGVSVATFVKWNVWQRSCLPVCIFFILGEKLYSN